MTTSNDQALNLAIKANNYKRGGNHLLKALAGVQKVLEDLFGDYAQFQFTHKHVTYLENLATSNVGEYGPALCFGHSDMLPKPLPDVWSSAGDGFYLHRDFKIWINTATRSEIIKVAADLPDFLKALAKFLDDKGKINDKSGAEIDKIVSAITDALDG